MTYAFQAHASTAFLPPVPTAPMSELDADFVMMTDAAGNRRRVDLPTGTAVYHIGGRVHIVEGGAK